tara:strand:- start:139 stop:423 length:285 start_codon:yes stop_codon:yes gene_type:complete
MIFQIINNVALAYTDSSGTTSALVIPSGLVRLCPTTACHISINPATGTAATTNDIHIGIGAETFVAVPNGYFISAIQTTAGGTLTIQAIDIGRP